ncbi:MAG: Flp pilus assembly protein CpaB [Tepidisphaeraceae bacterium]
MRTAVTLLVICGLVAALCATLLVRVLVRPRASVAAPEEKEVQLIVATKAMPAMTIVDGPATTLKTVKKQDVPTGALTNSVQVVGKILTRGMAEGEVFTKSSFATDQKGIYFAAAIAEGKRAVTISLQDHNGMAGILYPGSVVDVLVTMMASGEGTNTAVATTALQGLQVIGVGTQTVAAEEEFKDKNPGALAKSGQINYRMVTLLVTPKQAEILQLATKFGSVSLAMRNPRDNKPIKQDLTRMADMAGGADSLGTNIGRMIAGMMRSMPPPQKVAAAAPAPVASADPFDSDKSGKKEKEQANVNPLWEMIILRGTAQEKRSFPLSQVRGDGSEMSADAANRVGTLSGVADPQLVR